MIEEPKVDEDDVNQQTPLDEAGQFLDDIYPKFAILGIFGTITVFFTSPQFGDPENISARIGAASSLLLLIFVSFWLALRAFKELGKNDNIIPTIAELGYAVIAVCAIGLSIATITPAINYPQTMQLLSEGVGTILLLLGFSEIYPADNSSDYSNDGVIIQSCTMISIWAAIFITFEYYSFISREFAANILGQETIYIIAPVICMAGFTFLVRESLIGALSLVSIRMGTIWARIKDPWQIRTSLMLSTGALAVLTWKIKITAREQVGENIGYYQIYGSTWPEFTLAHWFLLAIIFGGLLLARQSDYLPSHVKEAGRIAAIVIIVITIVEWFVIIPNGTHVIPI